MTTTPAHLTPTMLAGLAKISSGHWAYVLISTERALRYRGLVEGPGMAPHLTETGEQALREAGAA